MKRKSLSLRRETLSILQTDELAAIVGGLSDSCVTGTAVVCATVGDCITDDCVTAVTRTIVIQATYRCTT